MCPISCEIVSADDNPVSLLMLQLCIGLHILPKLARPNVSHGPFELEQKSVLRKFN